MKREKWKRRRKFWQIQSVHMVLRMSRMDFAGSLAECSLAVGSGGAGWVSSSWVLALTDKLFSGKHFYFSYQSAKYRDLQSVALQFCPELLLSAGRTSDKSAENTDISCFILIVPKNKSKSHKI